MTGTVESLDELRAAMAGSVLTPGDEDYAQACALWNGGITRRPAVVARCTETADVVAALATARRLGLEVSVRGGAHGYAGNALSDGGLTIDLSGMREVSVDPEARLARCGGGCTWGDVDAATQEHGLALPGGMISHTGIGGLTLGGGIGWLSHRHGLVIDNLESAKVVLADGRVVRAGPDSHPDLFWAIRGGGGNFGVVTEFEYRVHPVGPVVHMAMFFWGLDQAAAALRLGRDTTAGLSRDAAGFCVGFDAPPAPFVPEQHHLAPGVAFFVVGFGTAEEHAAHVESVRAALPPLFELVTSLPYTELQSFIDGGFPWGCHAYSRSLYLDELSEPAIDVIVENLPRRSSPMTAIPIFLPGGAFAEVADEATAFGGRRSTRCIVFVDSIALDAETLAAERTWSRAMWEQLRPLASDSGGYVNMLYEDADDRVRAVYGAKYERLARIKAEYDPGNVFHLNANIKPA